MLPYAAVAPSTPWFTSDGLLGNKFPPGIGAESFAVTVRQLIQPLYDAVDAAILRILQRAAAKRRKTGRKYRAGVEQVSILHGPLAKARYGLIEQRQNQSILQVL